MAVPISPHDAAVTVNHCTENGDGVTVHSLPPEVLALVLSQAKPPAWSSRRYYPSLFDIRSVCKQWMDIVNATPSLWTLVWLDSNLKLIRMILINSKTQLLTVWYDDQVFGGHESLCESHISSFISIVAPSSRRWEFLDYRASSDAQHERLLGLFFDELRQLKILLSGNITYNSALNAPQLMSLDVHRCSLNWHSVSGLRSLAIGQNTNGPNIDELMAVLRASPNLEQLKVERNWPMTAIAQPDHSQPLPHVFLPKLRVMCFLKLQTIPLAILLDQIEAPNLLRFSHSMTYKGFSDNFPRIFGAAGRHIGGDTQFRQDGNPFHLTVVANYEMLRVRVGDREIALRRFRWSEGDGHQEKLASLSAALARFHPNLCSAITVVSLEGSPQNEEIPEYLQLIHLHCPQLKELVVSGFKGDGTCVESIVAALSGGQNLNNRNELPFPELNTLRLLAMKVGSKPCANSILQLVQMGADSTQAETLTVLVLEGFRITRGTAEKLKSLVQELWCTRSEIVNDMVLSGSGSLPAQT